MNRTKLGIATGSFAAITFLSGLTGLLIVAVLAGYVLIAESDEKLRRNVIRAVVFVLVIMVVRTLVGALGDVLGTIDSFIHIFNSSASAIAMPAALNSFLYNVIDILEKVGLLVFALQATKGDDVKVPVVENILRKGF